MCSYSWRVPLTAGTGPLRIVASQDLGELGQIDTEPVICQWRWYYHFPLGILWIPLALLLFGVKENRTWRAWLILLSIFAAMIFWGLFVRLFQMPAEMSEPTTLLFGAVAMGWATVWLLAPWLVGRRWFVGYLLVLGTMLLMGVLVYGANFGVTPSQSSTYFFVAYGAASVALVLAMTLSGLCSRRHGRLGPFMAWLFLWTVLGTIVGLVITSVPMIVYMSGSGVDAIPIMVMTIVTSLIFGGFFGLAVYLTNVPFMILAFRNSLYRERLYGVLRMSTEPLSVGSPFTEGATVIKTLPDEPTESDRPVEDDAGDSARR